MKRTRQKAAGVFFTVILMITVLPGAYTEEQSTSLAVLDIGNLTYDPRYDYMEGIIWGLLLYDFSKVDDIALVERQDLERVLDEQRLALQGIVEDEDEAIRIGDLLGADYLLNGHYVFLGEDIILTLTCTRVADGRTISFSDRGRTENLVHSLVEKLSERLTGSPSELVSADGNRSIISLKDETPGEVALHSPLIDAEIYVDGEFYGYTSGNMTEPVLIDDLSPGEHRIETRCGRDFGVIDLPEIAFHPWNAVVDIKSGKRTVLRDETRHFNDILYRLMKLSTGEARSEDLREKPIHLRDTVSFTDREGVVHETVVDIRSTYSGETLMITCDLTFDGTKETVTARVRPDRDEDHVITNGKVKLDVEVSSRYNRYEVDYRLSRTDIEQNMWR